MLEYKARAGDELQFIYVLTRERVNEEYRLMVGDEITRRVSPRMKASSGAISFEARDPNRRDRRSAIDRSGTSRRKTVPELRKHIEKIYSDYLKNPSIDVTPIKTNTRLEDLRLAVATSSQ